MHPASTANPHLNGDAMLNVCIEIYASVTAFEDGEDPITTYIIDHDDDNQRRNLGAQCRSCFEAGQMVVTYAKPENPQ